MVAAVSPSPTAIPAYEAEEMKVEVLSRLDEWIKEGRTLRSLIATYWPTPRSR